MEITVFAKKRETKDGKSFYSYIATLTKKSGEKLTASIKFREECGNPKADQCPMNIIVDKADANLSEKVIGTNRETGEVLLGHTMWVSKWKPGSKYVDHSLDDYE